MNRMEKYIAWVENNTIIHKEIRLMKVLEFYNIIRTKTHTYGDTILASRVRALNKYKREGQGD